MLAVFERGSGKLKVGPDRSDNRNGVDVGRFQDVCKIRGELCTGARTACTFQGRRAFVAYRSELARLESTQVSNDVRTPVAIPDDAEAHDLSGVAVHHSPFRRWEGCSRTDSRHGV